ncbi:MAG TPA: protein kinase [Gemmatimonadales bacterium]|nr:protein kinase [Gemmatimonadales bacterium]
MFRLHTLGGLSLRDATGSPLPVPRLRLAFLAPLAVAGSRGVTRDKLAAFFWPESSTENARHALEQLLYSVRRQVGRELLLGADPLRLNPDTIATDVGEFQKAVGEGAWGTAVAVYGGPFLDGFFLSDAPEFEEWVETERTRLAGELARALYRLAREAGTQGQHTAEIDYWRKLSASDPLSERTAAGLARALASAGDWAAALQHSKTYDALVREELRGEGPTLTAMVEQLHAQRASGTVPAGPVQARYTIVREIGRGTVATVLLARDQRLNRLVALKVLRPELAASTATQRFHREIAILAGLHHPHILQIHDSGVLEPGGRWRGPFFVMPYVEGESLRDRIAREVQLPLEETVRLTGEIADALAYAHGRGVVHRDVKPGNILLESGHALLADFGVAYALDQASGQALSHSGVRLGSPHYMSPEQAAGQERTDARSDLYSLACVAYEMLAGEPPFTGATAQAIVARHAADPVPPLRTVRPDVPLEVEAVLRRALTKAPGERYASAEEFAVALRTSTRTPT